MLRGEQLALAPAARRAAGSRASPAPARRSSSGLFAAVAWSSLPPLQLLLEVGRVEADDDVVLFHDRAVVGHPRDLERVRRVVRRHDRRGLHRLQVALGGDAPGECASARPCRSAGRRDGRRRRARATPARSAGATQKQRGFTTWSRLLSFFSTSTRSPAREAGDDFHELVVLAAELQRHLRDAEDAAAIRDRPFRARRRRRCAESRPRCASAPARPFPGSACPDASSPDRSCRPRCRRSAPSADSSSRSAAGPCARPA